MSDKESERFRVKRERSSQPRDARAAAAHALGAILRRGRALDQALADAPGLDALSPRDAAFARLLLLTTLRRLGQIDAFLAGLMERPLPARRGAVQDVLRLGVAQLAFLETPAHAAVASTVALTQGQRLAPYRGFVNAVLRRASREHGAIAALDGPRLNTPDWLWQSWARAYGEERCRAIAESHLQEPPLDLSLASGPEDRAEALRAALAAERLPGGTLRLRGAGAVTRLKGYEAGAWWVQDAAAALPVRLLGPVAGKHVLEIGAAPGGKTAQLAAAGARVTAVDRSAARLARFRENLARLGLEAEIVEADALDWHPPALADAVLLDVPCTATGTIRRHPDIPHGRKPADVERLAALQGRLLARAAGMLARGGLFVYASCSLQPEECERQVSAFLAVAPEFARVPVRAGELAGFSEAITAAGDLRTLPCHWAEAGGMDGFYAARLRHLG
ncbi:MAG: methyltransferase domain-containing protein [Rhodospirillales bacterium]|nr:methyltransferase domain-containing protein [Rhodospirillales bacterium]